MPAPAITLLTDFGTADGYVAEMKGVLCTLAPDVPLIDVTHDIAPQDITAARLVLARCWRRFPAGTVHVVVVDPGVGTQRAAIAVESEGRFLVGPDNGVLSPALFALDARIVRLPVPITAAATFHGRDVFAPAAAALVEGAALTDLGEPFTTPVRLRTPPPRRDADGSLHGEVLTIDRFGNVITNLMTREPAPERWVAGAGCAVVSCAPMGMRLSAKSSRWSDRAVSWRSRCGTGVRPVRWGLPEGEAVVLTGAR